MKRLRNSNAEYTDISSDYFLAKTHHNWSQKVKKNIEKSLLEEKT